MNDDMPTFTTGDNTKMLAGFVNVADAVYQTAHTTYQRALNDGMGQDTAEVIGVECYVSIWACIKTSLDRDGKT